MQHQSKNTTESVDHTVRLAMSLILAVVVTVFTSITVMNLRDMQTKDNAYRACLESVERIAKESLKDSSRVFSLPSCSWGR